MSQVSRHQQAAADEPVFVVHVKDTISAALAGHDGVEYRSPPLSREEALALVRLVLGRGDAPRADEVKWRCPIAGGQRTVSLRSPAGTALPADGRHAAASESGSSVEHSSTEPENARSAAFPAV